MTAPQQAQLADLLLGQLPANGSTVANRQLLILWTQAAASAGIPVGADEFSVLREDLVAQGLVVKGKGRGGSTARAAASAPGRDAFQLEGAATKGFEADEAPTQQRTPGEKKAASKPKLRAADDGEEAQVLSYRHADRRKNNPEVGLVSEASDPQQPKKEWAYNPHLDPVLNFDSARAELENLVDDALASGDEVTMRAALVEIKRRGAPYLQWAGKAERTSFEVDTVSLHVHERIDPMSILSAVRKQMEDAKAKKAGKGTEAMELGRQASLFEAPFESLPLRTAVDFYRHDKGWANRLVAGDSLQVMNSLLVKEGMAGQVQMIYIDPPYGIKYGSNFQPFVGKRDVKDRSDADLTQEPEMIKAFRDTWELGLHSYLSFLRDRLLLAQALLARTGSVFVQISGENLHLVRALLDEVFGREQHVETIAYRTKNMTLGGELLEGVFDYVVWYAKEKKEVKFRRVYTSGSVEGDNHWGYFSDRQGVLRKMSSNQVRDHSLLPEGADPVQPMFLSPAGSFDTGLYEFGFRGKRYSPPPGRSWKTPLRGMDRLMRANRLLPYAEGGTVRYRSKLYHLYRDPDVQQDLNRRGAEPHEALPKLVQDAYTLLGADWRAALIEWQAAGHHSPPVMLTVCNRVETAARIEHYLNHGDAHWPELRSPEQTLRVDSRVLEKAEIGEKASAESVFKSRMASLLKALVLPELVQEKLDEAKKDAEKLKLLALHLALPADERAAFEAIPAEKQLEMLIQRAPLAPAVRDYLLGTTEYVNRLREIVKAARLPKDREERLLALDKEDLLRAIVDNVGKQGQAGQRLQSVISVAMLSEGWDAKNVTHIMGLRAFTSQLLCEQVIGRGLRRVGYDRDENGLFEPEYVNVFGVPLSVFVDTGDDGVAPPPPKPSTQIESLASRNELEVRWPNLLRVDTIIKPVLSVQWSGVSDLELDPAKTVITAELAPAVGGATDMSKTTNIDLSKLPEEFREQRIVFQAARKAFDQLSGKFNGSREYLIFQLIRLVEQFLASNKLVIPTLFHTEGVRRRILFALNMDLIVQHVVKYVEQQNVASIEPVFDPEQPIGSSRAMRTWYTTKGNQPTRKSQISHVVGDSSWEIYAGTLFDSNDMVSAYAKNDHLGFQIYYLWGGSRKRFVPDFIVRLANGKNLVLEIKGEDSPMNKAKRDALALWVKAVNAKGGFGAWCWDVAFKPAEIHDIVVRHAQGASRDQAEVLSWVLV